LKFIIVDAKITNHFDTSVESSYL